MAWNEPGGNDNQQDPWGGGKRGGGGGKDQGPPDLDEALKKLQDKLGGLLGGKKGGGSGSSTGMIGILLVVLAIAWFGAGLYRVDQAERAVILRFGEYYETVGPGLNWNPPLIDRVTEVNVAKVRSLSRRQLMLTEDENIVQVSLSVQYRVSNPKDFLLNVRSPEQTLEHATESALRHEVGSSEMTSVLTEGRAALAVTVRDRLQSYLDNYGVGLVLSAVNVENTAAPDQVQEAFDDVIRAREDEQRAQNQAEAYANGIIPEARGKAQRILEEANGYRESVIASAEGEADRFLKLLTEYHKAPEVTRQRLYLDAIEEVLSNSSKILVDVEGSNNLMYLPLDKLVQRQPQSASASDRSGRATSSRIASLEEIDELADRVLDRLRQRQESSRREGR